MQNTTNTARRKISLNQDYCPTPSRVEGGDPKCDHDFDAAPAKQGEDWVEYICTICGRHFEFEVWE